VQGASSAFGRTLQEYDSPLAPAHSGQSCLPCAPHASLPPTPPSHACCCRSRSTGAGLLSAPFPAFHTPFGGALGGRVRRAGLASAAAGAEGLCRGSLREVPARLPLMRRTPCASYPPACRAGCHSPPHCSSRSSRAPGRWVASAAATAATRAAACLVCPQAPPNCAPLPSPHSFPALLGQAPPQPTSRRALRPTSAASAA
jgi:hypothetical protein